MYSLIRKLLFQFPPETAHYLALSGLSCISRLGINPFADKTPTHPINVMGLDFPNPVGLAAGLDKNADYLDALATLGFGFLEVGTITPLPQSGNPKPRLFRIPAHEALINRMGFNNKGIDYLIERVKQSKYKGILGINIGKNKNTPAEKALDDYLLCLRKAHPYASYITLNISSPNTPGLRDFQKATSMRALLSPLLQENRQLSTANGRYIPIAVKIAPDLHDAELDAIAEISLDLKIDALIISNTTVSRMGIETSEYAQETGGLSGKPLMDLSTLTLKKLKQRLQDRIVLIGVGGILSAADTLRKKRAGAQLVQIYSGFIYRGPALIKEIASAFRQP